MPFDYVAEPEHPKPKSILRDQMDRYRRMKVVRDKAQARVVELELALAAMTRDRDHLAQVIRDLTHGDPL